MTTISISLSEQIFFLFGLLFGYVLPKFINLLLKPSVSDGLGREQ